MDNSTDTRPAIDIRTIPPHERHPRIFETLGVLTPGNSMILTSDHDPVPLRRHLDSLLSGVFGWEYLEQGPSIWRVEIARLGSEGCNCGCDH